MERLKIIISELARKDVLRLSNVIRYEYQSPYTALKYLKGLNNEINKLIYSAEAYKIQTEKPYTQYGFNVRVVRYKKMKIIYSVVNKTVYIKRILPVKAQ